MPTAVIVDADHVIRWIDIHPYYSTRSEPADITRCSRPLTVHPTPKEPDMTVRLGVLALLEAKPGKGDELGAFPEHRLEHPLGQIRQQPTRAHQAHPIGLGALHQLPGEFLGRRLPGQSTARRRLHHRGRTWEARLSEPGVGHSTVSDQSGYSVLQLELMSAV